ncbi:phosphopantetheinyl transferase [Erwinia sp. E_sp_B04_7]|uniref:4'-phosphopantetheinyl transferase family protein n=1 Tax=unclassified Erwinia TaxID=2622719 RepID=UPI0030D34031
MASHFARQTLIHGTPQMLRIPQNIIDAASLMSGKRRLRFLAARALLAEMMLRVYGISHLPEVIATPNGRPCFADSDLPDFSIAYADNLVGVLLAEEGGRAGLGLEIIRAHSRQTQELYLSDLSSGEKAWINAQTDPNEAATQLWAIRKSLVKLTGPEQGHGDSLRLHPASGRLRSPGFPDIQAISDVEPLLVWSCALSPGNEQLHLWECDEEANWTRLKEIAVNTANVGQRMLRLTCMPPEKALQN